MQVSFKATLINNSFVYRKNSSDFNLKQNAKFLKVDLDSDEDYDALRGVALSWSNNAPIAQKLFDMFTSQKAGGLFDYYPKYDYFALSNREDNKLDAESILGLASLRKEDNKTIILQYLQVNPEHTYSSKDRQYRYIGKAIIESIIKMLPNKDILLYPYTEDAAKFYKTLDFKKMPNSFYMMRKAKH